MTLRTLLSVFTAALAAFTACVGDDSSQSDGGPNDATTNDVTTNDVATNDVVTTNDAGDGGKPRYCATQSPPDGAVDFTCADFDGVNLGEGFTDASVDDGASLTANALAAVSAPNSLLAQTPAGDDTTSYSALYTYQVAGGKRLQTVNVTASMNPFPAGNLPPHIPGELPLVSMFATNTRIDFSYTRDNTSTNQMPSYVGYFVRVFHKNLTSTVSYFEVDPLPENIWTEVSLGYNEETGEVTLTYDGATKLDQQTGIVVTETLASVALGITTVETTVLYSFRFDNVRIWTTRDP